MLHTRHENIKVELYTQIILLLSLQLTTMLLKVEINVYYTAVLGKICGHACDRGSDRKQLTIKSKSSKNSFKEFRGDFKPILTWICMVIADFSSSGFHMTRTRSVR